MVYHSATRLDTFTCTYVSICSMYMWTYAYMYLYAVWLCGCTFVPSHHLSSCMCSVLDSSYRLDPHIPSQSQGGSSCSRAAVHTGLSFGQLVIWLLQAIPVYRTSWHMTPILIGVSSVSLYKCSPFAHNVEVTQMKSAWWALMFPYPATCGQPKM